MVNKTEEQLDKIDLDYVGSHSSENISGGDLGEKIYAHGGNDFVRGGRAW